MHKLVDGLNTRRLVIWISFLAVFAMSARISIDTDTWWHLRAGQWIVEQRTVPQTDPFSYTRYGEPWQYPGWLAEVPMYGIHSIFGPGGLNLWTALMVTLAFAFVWQTLSGGPFLRAFVIVLAAAASAVYWAARPYLVTFLLVAIYLWILEGFRWKKHNNDDRRLWWLPILMIIWANSHGGFAVGFLLWGVYFAWEGGRFMWSVVYARWFTKISTDLKDSPERTQQIYLRRFTRLGFVGIFLVLAVCINPSGPIMLTYPFKTMGIGTLHEYIQEWQSPDFHTMSVQPFAWMLLLTIGLVGASRKRLAFTDFALVAGFAYMGLLAVRNIALFAIVSPMVMTRHAAPLFASLGRMFGVSKVTTDRYRKKLVILNWVILVVLFLAVGLKVIQVLPNLANKESFQENLPVQAVEFLEENKPLGRMFNSYNWGSYLLWMLPDYPVFVDGRTDLYNDEILEEWLAVVRAEDDWQTVLDEWNVDWIILEPDMPIVNHLENYGWKSVFSDQVAAIYAR